MYQFKYTKEAEQNLRDLKKQGQLKKLKKIKEALDKLKENPRHPGLHTHKNESFKTDNNEDVFQSYAENHTPSAYRIFWYYGPDKNFITIVTITQHP
ncbi:type II toxin-antitoxin system RelE/ParE family toxin [bacterium]|nr:type II toxin-antitoxin system RelE/ParE family toxin [bacterium]